MRIWEHTLKDLIGNAKVHDADDGEMCPQPFILESVVLITHNPKYATAFIRGGGSLANQALLELRDEHWVCVGRYRAREAGLEVPQAVREEYNVN